MAETTAKMKRWLKEMKQATTRLGGSAKSSVTVKDDTGLKQLATMATPGFFEGIMQQFIDQSMLGPQGALYHQFAPALALPYLYEPKIFGYEPKIERAEYKKGRTLGGQVAERLADTTEPGETAETPTLVERKDLERRKDVRRMFSDVWAVMQKNRVWSDGGGHVWGGIGPLDELMSLALGPYMPVQGKTNASASVGMNRLFLAVEYGTGIASNVGGAQWVRHDGPTKERNFGGYEGAWWLGRKRKDGSFSGVMFEGQRGVHFLDDVRTRQPLAIYMHQLQQVIPRLIAEKLSTYAG